MAMAVFPLPFTSFAVLSIVNLLAIFLPGVFRSTTFEQECDLWNDTLSHYYSSTCNEDLFQGSRCLTVCTSLIAQMTNPYILIVLIFTAYICYKSERHQREAFLFLMSTNCRQQLTVTAASRLLPAHVLHEAKVANVPYLFPQCSLNVP
jgi:hypothetical protein